MTRAELEHRWQLIVGVAVATIAEPQWIERGGTMFVVVHLRCWANLLEQIEPALVIAWNTGRARSGPGRVPPIRHCVFLSTELEEQHHERTNETER